MVEAASWVYQGGQTWQEPSPHRTVNIVMKYEVQTQLGLLLIQGHTSRFHGELEELLGINNWYLACNTQGLKR